MEIQGKKIRLRPATESDRRKIFIWLTQSDLTSSMMGTPHYPDHPIPSWEEFNQDYNESFFDPSGDGKGRAYIILNNDEEVGTIGYDLLDKQKKRVVLDIWMRAEKYCGSGYGSDSVNTLCDYIHQTYAITHFLISPSARNKRAVEAYKKSGFRCESQMTREEQEREFGMSECDDNILMRKIIK